MNIECHLELVLNKSHYTWRIPSTIWLMMKLTQLTTRIAKHPPRSGTFLLRALFIALFFHIAHTEDNFIVKHTSGQTSSISQQHVGSIEHEAPKECLPMTAVYVQAFKVLRMVYAFEEPFQFSTGKDSRKFYSDKKWQGHKSILYTNGKKVLSPNQKEHVVKDDRLSSTRQGKMNAVVRKPVL